MTLDCREVEIYTLKLNHVNNTKDNTNIVIAIIYWKPNSYVNNAVYHIHGFNLTNSNFVYMKITNESWITFLYIWLISSWRNMQ